jgi:mevalonate kinase
LKQAYIVKSIGAGGGGASQVLTLHLGHLKEIKSKLKKEGNVNTNKKF